MRYLVTGGAGFIGSNLVQYLLQDEENIVEVWDTFVTGKPNNLFDCPVDRLTLKNIDVTNVARQDTVEYDAIFHLAAEARIQPSFERMAESYKTNAFGTASMIEYAKGCGSPFIFVSSSTVDGDPMANPYAMAKHHGEDLIKMASQIYGISTVGARPYNVYGPNQEVLGEYATLIGIFQRQILNNEPLTITGDGEQRRDFTYVSDIVKGLVHLSKSEYKGEVFGLGTGVSYSVNEIAEMFRPGGEHVFLPQRPGEVRESLAKNLPPGWSAPSRLEAYIKGWLNARG